MANDITTLITITGTDGDIDALLARHIVTLEGGPFLDFRTVIERPACVDATNSGSRGDAGWYALTRMVEWNFAGLGPRNPMAHYMAEGFKVDVLTTPADFAAWLREHHPEVIAEGEAQTRCYRETGCRSWFEWEHGYWGTRGNSYDFSVRARSPGKAVLQLDTANGVATKVYRRLSVLWPGLTFDIEAVDEGGPEFAGVLIGGTGNIVRVPEDRARYVRVMGHEPDSEDEAASEDEGRADG